LAEPIRIGASPDRRGAAPDEIEPGAMQAGYRQHTPVIITISVRTMMSRTHTGSGARTPEQVVHTRVAEHVGRLYLDLADERWRAVEIGPDGWQVIPPKAPKGFACSAYDALSRRYSKMAVWRIICLSDPFLQSR
jgi:hypothetical protein